MSDQRKPPSPPPPDDFSKTTPNIRIPNNAQNDDWGAPSRDFPNQPGADDWGNTVTNLKPIDIDREPNTAKPVDWGMTQANVDMTREEYSRGSNAAPDDFGAGYDKTTPYFRLPEAERQKYQNIPPSPAEQAAIEQREKEEKGGVPGWVWVTAGLMTMFFFAIIVLGVVYVVLLRPSGFEANLIGAPPGGDVQVDKVSWGLTEPDGSKRLPSLKAGQRFITVAHPSFVCPTIEITGKDGVNPSPIYINCTEKKVDPGENCADIGLGQFDKAERCYNAALNALPDGFSVEDLLKALNILIINFESGKYDIPPARLAALQKGATYIKKLPPSVVLEVGGHTDNVGNDASNQTLSENRANAVKDVLLQYGVNASTLQTKGYGKNKPKTTNDTPVGKFYNRRIEYSLVKQ